MDKFDYKKYEEAFTFNKPIQYIPIKIQNQIIELNNQYQMILQGKDKKLENEKLELYKETIGILQKIYNIEQDLQKDSDSKDDEGLLIFKEKLDSELEQLKEKQINLQKNRLEEIKNKMNELSNQCIHIYPVALKDYFMFYSTISCLIIEKDKSSDIRVLSMAYLDFLFDLIENDENKQAFAYMFMTILKLTLKIKDKDIEYRTNGKHRELIINKIILDRKDFDNIRRIICYQNMPDYDDTYIDPDLERVIKTTERIENKDSASISLEGQIDAVIASTSYKYNELYELPIRRFVLLLREVDSKLHYQIYKTGEVGGMVTFKEPIPYWIYSHKKNRVEGKLINFNDFKNHVGKALSFD